MQIRLLSNIIIKSDTQHIKYGKIIQKHLGRTSLKQVIKRFEAFGTMKRQKGCGHQRTATTPLNKESVEEIICFQEHHPRNHLTPKYIAKGLKISQSSVQRMIKRTFQTYENTSHE